MFSLERNNISFIENLLFKKIFQVGEKHWNAVYLTTVNDGCWATGEGGFRGIEPTTCVVWASGQCHGGPGFDIATWNSEIFPAVPSTVAKPSSLATFRSEYEDDYEYEF